MTDHENELIWLAADYHLPSTYSIRVPMSSMSSGLALPAPGPATVRLALIRTAIEFFGVDHTRDALFPVIRSMPVCIRPPEKVALSRQLSRAYKASEAKRGGEARLDSSIAYREHAHAAGILTVYVQVPVESEAALGMSLANIGYWGQSSSLASCVNVRHAPPRSGEYAIPLRCITEHLPIQAFFCCLATEFRDSDVSWDEILPQVQVGDEDAIRLELYAWPLVISERREGNTHLLRRSLPTFQPNGVST